jgi:hypothetical protein
MFCCFQKKRQENAGKLRLVLLLAIVSCRINAIRTYCAKNTNKHHRLHLMTMMTMMLMMTTIKPGAFTECLCIVFVCACTHQMDYDYDGHHRGLLCLRAHTNTKYTKPERKENFFHMQGRRVWGNVLRLQMLFHLYLNLGPHSTIRHSIHTVTI